MAAAAVAVATTTTTAATGRERIQGNADMERLMAECITRALRENAWFAPGAVFRVAHRDHALDGGVQTRVVVGAIDLDALSAVRLAIRRAFGAGISALALGWAADQGVLTCDWSLYDDPAGAVAAVAAAPLAPPLAPLSAPPQRDFVTAKRRLKPAAPRPAGLIGRIVGGLWSLVPARFQAQQTAAAATAAVAAEAPAAAAPSRTVAPAPAPAPVSRKRRLADTEVSGAWRTVLDSVNVLPSHRRHVIATGDDMREVFSAALLFTHPGDPANSTRADVRIRNATAAATAAAATAPAVAMELCTCIELACDPRDAVLLEEVLCALRDRAREQWGRDGSVSMRLATRVIVVTVRPFTCGAHRVAAPNAAVSAIAPPTTAAATATTAAAAAAETTAAAAMQTV